MSRDVTSMSADDVAAAIGLPRVVLEALAALRRRAFHTTADEVVRVWQLNDGEDQPAATAEVREEWGVLDTDGELIPLASHRSLDAWRRRGLTLVRRTVTTTRWEPQP